MAIFPVILVGVFLLQNAAAVTQNCPGSPQYDVTFNQLNNTFEHPYTSNSSTPVGNLTLFIRKDVFTETFDNKTSISLNFFPIERGHLAIDGAEGDFPIDDDSALGVGTQQRLWTPQMMTAVTINSTEYGECIYEDTLYLSIPVVFLLRRGPRVVGRRRWVIDLETIGSGEISMNVAHFNTTVVTVVAKPVQKCNQTHYVFGNDTCVTECPCHLKTFPDFCYEFSVGEFSQAITDVIVSANITNGILATINVLLDQNIKNINNETRLIFIPQYLRVRGDQIDHDKRPEVELSILSSNVNLNNFMDGISLDFPILNLNVNSLADCGKYKILPLQLNLVSPSINQLGEHVINIHGTIVNESIMMDFTTLIVIDVETSTSCTDGPNNLLNLLDQRCVSECPCGFIPFQHTTASYCEPVDNTTRPAWFADDQLRIVANEGTSINGTFKIYTSFMFRLSSGPPSSGPMLPPSSDSLISTDSVTMLLRIEQISSSTLQSSLQFNGQLSQNHNISLNSSYLEGRGLKSCDEGSSSYITITSVIPEVPEAGEYTFDIVARFTSTVNETEDALRDEDRQVNVTQVLRVNLKALSVTPTIVSMTSTVRPSPSVSPVPDNDKVIVVLSIKTFTPEKEIAFQITVADSVNMHCRNTEDQCRGMNKRQVVAVQADDVVIESDMKVTEGVRLQFYVKRMEGVIPPQAVVTAVKANRQAFTDRNITVDDIMLAVPSSSTPVVSPTVTPPAISPQDLSVGAIIGIAVAPILAVIIVMFVFILVIVWLRRRNCFRSPEADNDHNIKLEEKIQ